MNSFGIDVETYGKAALIRALARLKGTVTAKDNGTYREDAGYSVVHYTGSMTADAFDAWAYRVKVGQCVVSTFPLL